MNALQRFGCWVGELPGVGATMRLIDDAACLGDSLVTLVAGIVAAMVASALAVGGLVLAATVIWAVALCGIIIKYRRVLAVIALAALVVMSVAVILTAITLI